MSVTRTLRRFYMQFLVIVLIAVVFAYILNFVFLIDENETRIMFTALFLMAFAFILMAFDRVLD
jgi:hypothetical protein